MVERSIAYNGREIRYVVRRHSRARRTVLTMHPDGAIMVTLTATALQQTADRFILKHWTWITGQLERAARQPRVVLPRVTGRPSRLFVEAKNSINEIIAEIAPLYPFLYNSVRIKNVKKQWGSCSVKKNLNYNIRIALLPRELQRLIVVHEYCHLGHLNHSKLFWNEVKKAIPDYKQLEKELRRYVIV